MIKVGDSLPGATLMEYSEVEGNGCSIGPNAVDVAKAAAGKTIALFALPGAFTPTCHRNHLPGYRDNYDALKAKGVDTVAVTAVNDAFVMGAWRDATSCGDKIEFLADGGAAFTKAAGLTLDLTERGLGIRMRRFSMLVEDGVVKTFNLEEATGPEESGVDKMLTQV